jgi:rhodanese-related sulfurtransferase
MYDSLHQKLMTLPDATLVYPAHGAGSLCGRNMRAEKSSTIATERLTNYALQIPSRDEFVRQLTTNLPTRPDYFAQDAELNRSGAAPLTDLPPLPAMTAPQVKALLDEGEIVLDVRPMDQFAAGHIPGSINIALSGQFASWAGTLFGLGTNLVLVAESDPQVEEARMRLARVGIEKVLGYLAGGIAKWREEGLPLSTTKQINVADLSTKLRVGQMNVLDVRREGEFQAGHIEDAHWHALDRFAHDVPDVSDEKPLAVHCKGGYRSMIACSLLERAGHRNLVNVVGGFDAWQGAGLPQASGQLAKA